MRAKGFSLVELLATIVILAVILVITVPTVLNLISLSTQNAMEINARSILRSVAYKLIKDNNFDLKNINASNIETLMSKVSSSNIQSISVNTIDGKPFVVLWGKNKWNNILAYGTEDNIKVINNINDYPNSGLKLHFDALNISGLKFGDKISTWSDISGYGNDGVQTDTSLQPVYSASSNTENVEILSKMTPVSSTTYDALNDNQFSSNTTYGGCPVSYLINDSENDWLWNNGAGSNLDIYFKSSASVNIDRFQLYLQNGYGVPSDIKLYRRVGNNWEYIESFSPSLGFKEYNLQNKYSQSNGWLIRIEHSDWIAVSKLRIFTITDETTSYKFPVVRFNQQWLTTNKAWSNFTSNSNYTAFVLGKSNSISTDGVSGYVNQGYFGDRAGNVSLYLRSNGTIGAYNWDTGSRETEQQHSTNYFLAMSQLSDGAIKLRVDKGSETSTPSSTTISTSSTLDIARVFDTYLLNGDICEIFIYNRALTDTEKNQVIQYLGKKWLNWN